MSLYDGPRDVTEHLRELERRYGGAATGHRDGPASGWRVERRLARASETGGTRGSPNVTKAVFLRILGAILAVLHLRRRFG